MVSSIVRCGYSRIRGRGWMTWTLFYRTVDVASLEFDSVPEVHSDVPLRMNPAPITSTKSKGMMSSRD